MRNSVLLVLVFVLAGCSAVPPAGSGASPASSTPGVSGVPSAGPVSPGSTAGGLDFSDLPVSERPVLECIPVSGEDGALLMDYGLGFGDLLPAPGFRIVMGEGNHPGEVWSLALLDAPNHGHDFWLTNYFSERKPSGNASMLVGYTGCVEPERCDFWDWRVEWSEERLAAARAAGTFLATCS